MWIVSPLVVELRHLIDPQEEINVQVFSVWTSRPPAACLTSCLNKAVKPSSAGRYVAGDPPSVSGTLAVPLPSTSESEQDVFISLRHLWPINYLHTAAV